MNTGKRLTAICATLSLMTGLAYGQGQSSQRPSSQQQGQQGSSGGQHQAPVEFKQGSTLGGDQGLAMQPGQKQVLFVASQLIGKEASTPQGQNLGKLAEIVFGLEQGAFAVLDLPNNRQTAVPWQLVIAVTPESVVINTTQAAVAQAPALQGNKNYASFNNQQFTKQLFSYYKVQQQGMGSGGQSQSGQGQSGQQSGQSGQQSGSPGSQKSPQ